ncbi:hypothetical protein BKA62DRAFT_685283 [Auriculariales sp. MPI-PUGE-AT-0066]|nr:hypothetical protein BKA62DRAFT_685283 [Auriculariales sp. MPI-PUGE-AT-0066]
MSHFFSSKNIDKIKSKVARRQTPQQQQQRPTTPPSPGSFFTSPRSPRWTTRSVASDTSSVYAIPPVPERPPPLPEVMPIMAPPPKPASTGSSSSRRRPSADANSEPGVLRGSFDDRDPLRPRNRDRPVTHAPPPVVSGHKKAASVSRATLYTAPSDALSPNSVFSTSTSASSPATTLVSSYSSSNLGAVSSKKLNLTLNVSDPILPHFHSSIQHDDSPPSRRHPPLPTPIRIPNGSHHLPSLDRSVDDGAGTSAPERPVAGPPPDEPPSPGTAHDTILASAFVLESSSTNGDQAWSGSGTGLTRMDSATLPRDSYIAGANNAMGKLRGPRPIRTNSRRQSAAPASVALRRSVSAASFLPSTPPAIPDAAMLPPLPTESPPLPPSSRASSRGSPPLSQPAPQLPRPTVVVSGPDQNKRRRISAIDEQDSAGSVYSFQEPEAENLRPVASGTASSIPPQDFLSMTLHTVSASPFSESLRLPGEEEDEFEDSRTGSRASDNAPVLDQLWEFLLPDGSNAATPRSNGSFSTSQSPLLDTGTSSKPLDLRTAGASTASLVSPRPTTPGLSPQSVSPNGASSGVSGASSKSASPKLRNQKPTMLKLADPPQRSPLKRKSFEIVQDSTPESPEFRDADAPRSGATLRSRSAKEGRQVPSVPQTAALDDMMSPGLLSRQTSQASHVGKHSHHGRPGNRSSTSPISSSVGGASSSNGHSSTGSNGVFYVTFKKDSTSGMAWPDTPRSGDTFSPPMSQTFTVEATPSTSSSSKSRTRVPTLPIGVKANLPHIRTEAATMAASSSTGRTHSTSRRPSAASVAPQAGSSGYRNPLPPSPKFNTAPVRWKGLTYDAARWTLSSDQLQEVVARAIKQSAEASSIRLLHPEVLEEEMPAELERLTRDRDDLRTKLKAQIRSRRLLLRKISSEQASTPIAQTKQMAELMEACAACDQTSEELFHVCDQLAQIQHLRDVHQSSALALALRKINTSFVRVTTEAVELRGRLATLEAEREEAWHTAESVEKELNELREKVAQRASTSNSVGAGLDTSDQALSDEPATRPSSRVSAARKASLRASKASLRLSTRKSRASSIASSRYTALFSPDPMEGVPPVPPMPNHSSHSGSPHAILTDFSARLRQSTGASSFVSYTMSPSPEQSALAMAQAELLELLGLQLSDINGSARGSSSSGGVATRRSRPRSASDAQPPTASLSPMFTSETGTVRAGGVGGSGSPPASPRWTVSAASPAVSEYFGRRIRRSMSDFNSKATGPRPDSMLLSLSREGPSAVASGLFEDPDGMLALMTRGTNSNEPSPLPGLGFPNLKRTYL